MSLATMGAGGGARWFVGAAEAIDFANGWTLSGGTPTSLLTCTRATTTSYAPTSTGSYTSFSADVPRITDLGLLTEESRTNSCANNSGTGAVAGTPGTLPTGWSITLLSTSQEVVGTGTSNGIDYVDIRIFGTPGSTNNLPIIMNATSAIAASAGQSWTESVFLAIVGGDFTNVGTVALRMNWQGAGSDTDGGSIKASLTSTLQRFTLTGTAPASTTFVTPRIFFGVTSGQGVDFTIRIGWPQIELGAFVTSPIRTTSAAASRAADVVTLTTVPVSGTTWSAFSDATITNFAATRYLLAESINNRVLYTGADTQAAVFNGTTAAATNPGSGLWSTGGRAAVAADGSGRAIAMNNGAVGTNANTQTFPTTLAIGGATGANAVITTRRIALWSVRLTNAQLQAITA